MARRDLEDREVMRLGLSSAAAPDADLEELTAACLRRGLAGLELRTGDAHGIAPDRSSLERAAAAAHAAAAGVVITGYRVCLPGDPVRLARLAESLGAPILLDCEGDSEGDAGARTRRIPAALRLRELGAAVAIVVRGAAAAEDARAARDAGLSVAWDADPEAGSLAAQAEALLRDCAGALRHIRLMGGGPEVALHEGKGIGALMAQLALSGFDGELVLSPGSSRYYVAWESWLGRRGGWGCGSKAETAVVPLAREPIGTGAGR